MIYRFDTLSSTNDEAQSEKYVDGDLIVAEHQSAGRGQRGNKWLSGEGLNLTLSAVVEPREVAVADQFQLLQSSALSICDMLQSYGLDPRIKWTNDIYIGDEKIVGILIENKIGGGYVKRSIVGIGLNVNQREFDPSLPNPTSMTLATGVVLDRDEVVARLSEALSRRFEMLSAHQAEQLSADYHSLIYRKGELHSFKLPSGELISGTIVGVRKTGELIIKQENGTSAEYLFGAIDFVIARRKR